MTLTTLSPRGHDASTFAWHDLLPLAGGALTMLVASIALTTASAGTHTSPHQFWVGFVPVGALASGVCAASGFYLGALASGRRPGARVTALMRISSIPVYVAICALLLRVPVRGPGTNAVLLSSEAGLRAAIRVVSLDPSGLNTATVTGILVYPLMILAGLGFAIGVAAVMALLAAPIHCHRCRRYLPRGARRYTRRLICEFETLGDPRGFSHTAIAPLVRRPHAARSDA